MTDDALLPIGMFSRASLLSVKTLRAYHESGILVPASVDPRTGYRNYTVDQLTDAAVIVRLRGLDLPLGQVRDILARRDPEFTAKVLAEHRFVMEDRLAETERIVAELQSDPVAVTHTPVHVRVEEARPVLQLVGTVTNDTFSVFLGQAFDLLWAAVGATGAVPVGPPGALYPDHIIDDDEPVVAVIPLAEPVEVVDPGGEVSAGLLPPVEVAVLVHAGDYAGIGSTYLALGAWVARNAGHAGLQVREWYVVGPGDGVDPDGYRTEIAWPIDAGSARSPIRDGS